MMKTVAIQDAHGQMHNAIADLAEAKAHLGSIRRAALSDGGLRHIKSQMQKIETLLMELRDYADTIDYELDDLKYVHDNGNGGE